MPRPHRRGPHLGAERYQVGDVLRYSRASKETGIGKSAYVQMKSIDAPNNRLTVELQSNCSTAESKPTIRAERISAGMVGILLNSCSPRELQRLIPESGVCLEGTTTRVRMSYGVAESELLTEETVLRRVQRAMSYKFRTGLDVNKEVNSNP